MNDLQIAALERTDIATWDFERIKANLGSALAVYKNTVYTDETIKSAKDDKATLAKAKKQTVLLKDIVDTDLIISSRHSREEEIRSWFEPTGKEPRFIVKTAHSSNASKLVDQNIGIAIFPASVAKNISADSDVVVKKIVPQVNVDYILSWDKEKTPSALASKFIEHVRGLYS